MNRSMDEGLLLGRLAHGDHDAFWELWAGLQPELYRHCLRWLGGDSEEATDALSEAMVRAWERLPDHVGQIQDVRAWLTQLTHHVCLSLQDKRVRQEQHLASEGALALEEIPSGWLEDDPEGVILQREIQVHLLHLIDRLPSSLREPFILYALEEQSYQEMAEGLNLSNHALRKRVQRARQKLQEGLQDYLDGSGRVSWRDFLSLELPRTGSADLTGDGARTERLLNRALEEIRWQVAETRVVSITLPSGVVMDYSLRLDRKLPRRQVKIKTLRNYVQRYPTGWKKRLELAHLLYATGQWEEAIAEYRRVLERQPRQLDVWLRLGEALRLMGRNEEALEAYKSALSYARQPATKHHVQGWMELCRQRSDAAVQEFAQAAALEPRNAAHWHALGEVHLRAGRPCECLQAYDEALKLDPDDLVALTRSHDALTATAQLPEAIHRLERVVALDPNYVQALKMLATHRSASGLLRGDEGKKTHQLIRRALRLAPDVADVWETLAHFYVRRGEWELARAVLQEFVNQHPNNSRGWFHYAVWHYHTGHPEAAAEGILTALRLDTQDYYFYWCACMVLPEAGKREDLQRVVEEMLARFPERWDTYIDAAEALGRGWGEWNRACELSRQALDRQPHSPIVWSRHGVILAQAGRWEEATAALERAWSLLPEDSRPGNRAGMALWLGRSYRALGEAAQAQQWFREAAHWGREEVTFDPSSGYECLGQALESLGDLSGAIQAYQSALEHHLWYPSHQEVEEALERLRGIAR